ncbi:MAG: hypothetical protein HFE62_05200, partial [Firmicutes bacterium]|nr:hypothetical protein [Bacillota bacterium]
NRVRAAARNEVERFPKGNSRACWCEPRESRGAKCNEAFCEAKFESLPSGLGAYFSMLALHSYDIKSAFFLSPVTNMKHVIQNIMKKFDITEEMLKNKVTIETPEQPLCWEYHEYIVKNPILSWNVATYMLRGEHHFHTYEQLRFFGNWIEEKLLSLKV